MKKLVKVAAVLIGTSVAGVLAWRKIESDRVRNDLWTEAERIASEQDAATPAQPASASRV